MVSRTIPAAAEPFFPLMMNLPSCGNSEYFSMQRGSRGISSTSPTSPFSRLSGNSEVIVRLMGSISLRILFILHFFSAVP